MDVRVAKDRPTSLNEMLNLLCCAFDDTCVLVGTALFPVGMMVVSRQKFNSWSSKTVSDVGCCGTFDHDCGFLEMSWSNTWEHLCHIHVPLLIEACSDVSVRYEARFHVLLSGSSLLGTLHAILLIRTLLHSWHGLRCKEYMGGKDGPTACQCHIETSSHSVLM